MNNPLRPKENDLGFGDRRTAIVILQQKRGQQKRGQQKWAAKMGSKNGGCNECYNPQIIVFLCNQRSLRRKSSPQAE
jgi:hypothetical protein